MKGIRIKSKLGPRPRREKDEDEKLRHVFVVICFLFPGPFATLEAAFSAHIASRRAFLSPARGLFRQQIKKNNKFVSNSLVSRRKVPKFVIPRFPILDFHFILRVREREREKKAERRKRETFHVSHVEEIKTRSIRVMIVISCISRSALSELIIGSRVRKVETRKSGPRRRRTEKDANFLPLCSHFVFLARRKKEAREMHYLRCKDP